MYNGHGLRRTSAGTCFLLNQAEIVVRSQCSVTVWTPDSTCCNYCDQSPSDSQSRKQAHARSSATHQSLLCDWETLVYWEVFDWDRKLPCRSGKLVISEEQTFDVTSNEPGARVLVPGVPGEVLSHGPRVVTTCLLYCGKEGHSHDHRKALFLTSARPCLPGEGRGESDRRRTSSAN